MIIQLPIEKYGRQLKDFFCADQQTLKIVYFLIILQALGVVAGLIMFPHGYAYLHKSLFEKLIAWDGQQYISIADQGYHGDLAYCAQHYCNIIFFPIQGLIDKVFIFIFGPHLSFFFIFLSSWCFGLISIFLFARLARTIMGDRARNAIFLYALYPASTFYLMGYPTGLLSIFVILTLHKTLEGKWWQSALYVGLGTATAPVMAFVGLPVGIYYMVYQFRHGRPLWFLPNIAGWAALALSGLILFMIYQYFMFGSAFDFITGEQAWGKEHPPFMATIERLTSIQWYLAYYNATIRWALQNNIRLINIPPHDVIVFQNMSMHPADFFELIFQSSTNVLFFILAWVGVISCCFFCRPLNAGLLICASGCCALFCYMWFMLATEMNMTATIRVIFPAIAMFIGLGGLSSRFKELEYMLFPVFTLVSFIEVAYVVSGFYVI